MIKISDGYKATYEIQSSEPLTAGEFIDAIFRRTELKPDDVETIRINQEIGDLEYMALQRIEVVPPNLRNHIQFASCGTVPLMHVKPNLTSEEIIRVQRELDGRLLPRSTYSETCEEYKLGESIGYTSFTVSVTGTGAQAIPPKIIDEVKEELSD